MHGARFLLVGLLVSSSLASPAGAQPPTEASRWLQGYLRIDTSNPPGNEHRAAHYLAKILHREGIATRLLVTPEGRTSLYARLEASGSSTGSLLLLHHMDVVPAGEGWSIGAFSGKIRSGRLWGRGAVDDKSLGIAHLAAFVDLKRQGAPLQRPVIFLAVADEENGGQQGTAWLLENHPELFAGVEAALGEGGSNRVVGERLLWWGVEVAQKRPLWLEITARGRAGHGSGLNPQSAVHQLVSGLARVLDRPPRYRVTPAARQYFEALAPLHGERFQRIFRELDALVARGSLASELLPGMPNYFLDTLQVTSVQAGGPINVVPDEARARLDIRLLPDTDTETFLAEVREALGDGFDLEILVSAPRISPSPTTTPVYRSLERLLATRGPVVPAFIPGTTDSRFLRQRGIPAYGFSPFALDSADVAGIHSVDESISLATFQRGVATLQRVVTAIALRSSAPAPPAAAMSPRR